MNTTKTKNNQTYMICENPRFFCLSRVNGKPKTFTRCDCGSVRHDIGSKEGARLKVLRAQKKGVFSAGDSRKPMSRISKFAEEISL